jgi:hypothetical protein
VVVEQLAQGAGRNLEGRAVGAGDGADDVRPPRQLLHVAGEVAGAVDRHGRRLAGGDVLDTVIANWRNMP